MADFNHLSPAAAAKFWAEAQEQAAQSIAAANQARSFAAQVQNENPTTLVTRNQLGQQVQYVPQAMLTTHALQPVDEVIRWARGGATTTLALNAASPTVLGNITFRRRGTVVWGRCGTLQGTAAALAQLRIGVQMTTRQSWLTTNSDGGDYVEAPSLVGVDGSAPWLLSQEVNENDKWTVFGWNSGPGGASPIQALGAFGFLWARG